MLDFVSFLTDTSVANFLLLFVRLGGLFVFFPFFDSAAFFPTLKAAAAFLLSIIFYPLLPPLAFDLSVSNLILGVLTEVAFGMATGLILTTILATMQYAGELVSFVMGFSMATTLDPQSGISSPILSRFLNLFALMLFLVLDGHHVVLMFFANSVQNVSLGGFLFSPNYIDYIISSMHSLFVIGFSMAFPILALSLLSDIVFGMIMKTMPSFNLLVIGFPVKIAIAFIVFVAVFSSIALLFKTSMQNAFGVLFSLH